jgi:hypothetical protein
MAKTQIPLKFERIMISNLLIQVMMLEIFVV